MHVCRRAELSCCPLSAADLRCILRITINARVVIAALLRALLSIYILRMPGQPIANFPNSLLHSDSFLITLSLEDTLLSELPSSIGSLPYLKTLRISRAILADRFPLPDNEGPNSLCSTDFGIRCIAMEDFMSARHAMKLNVTFNTTRFVLPDSLQLSPLEDLRLGNLGLTEIPSQVFRLSRLNILRMNNNLLARIPEALSDMQTIEELFFRNNLLRDWPAHLGRLSRLETLHISGNPRLSPGPLTWDGQGWDALANFNGNDNRWNRIPAILANKWRTFRSLSLMYNNISSHVPGFGNQGGDGGRGIFLRGNPFCETQPRVSYHPDSKINDPCGECPGGAMASMPVPEDERGRVLVYDMAKSTLINNTTRVRCKQQNYVNNKIT